MKCHVAIFIGEFGAVRWSPENGAYGYLRDLVEIFEEYVWGWIYHEFGFGKGGILEYHDDKNIESPVSEPTPRQLLLRNYFG